MYPDIERIEAEADALEADAEATHFAATVLRLQAAGERLRIRLASFDAAVAQARAVAEDVAGCELSGWDAQTIMRYTWLFLRKEGKLDESIEDPFTFGSESKPVGRFSTRMGRQRVPRSHSVQRSHES
jgi:hypothetical protein